MQTIFITGTDTDAGKTYVAVALLQGLKALGYRTVAQKPVAAGVNGAGFNTDALQLQQHATEQLSYEMVNPYCLTDAVAPHLAAAKARLSIEPAVLTKELQKLQAVDADVALVEGAGGWLLPLDDHSTMADWVAEQQLPVLLVVGMKLGCLNHALLTVREIERSGLKLVGWVANCIDPDMAYQQENINYLQQQLTAPCLGVLPYQSEPQLNTSLASAFIKQLRN
ncbi:dethiobiotin synthase [Rheinheimera tangshanensis]|uniref:ATP-dependent dethiobiotin synthetase BioD n=1 Tax=Rheinheimera tangshanensis TaxID=400153 RepID=A0A5C8LX16_9GAMM|nr:dethiobiotin synthase [Rheinheimera tangshanensis]TXK80745.1 dethiobiotin synthase [Rheinheimera tangshanensis]GGM62434.1 ATP-dependent dethiobiotin synthetase BioD 1 [Rheinheimera tangshanensis]